MPAVHSPQENPRQGESEKWKHSPWMLSCSLERACFASLPLAFLMVCGVRVKAFHISPGCHLVSHTKIKSSRLECRESHLHSLISCNSPSRISSNALSESVQPTLESLFCDRILENISWPYFGCHFVTVFQTKFCDKFWKQIGPSKSIFHAKMKILKNS